MGDRRTMTQPGLPGSRLSGVALDGVASVLFAVFVSFLFLGYLNVDPGVPYSGLATLPLLGSLAALFWANLRAARSARDPLPA